MKYGQVIITEGNRHSIISWIVRLCTGSWATHCILVTGPDEGVEAWFPKVRRISLSERLVELEDQDRAYVVLDLPSLGPTHREQIAAKAQEFVGHFYDVGQALLFAIFRKFINDGSGTLHCARVITAAYKQGAGISLFTEKIIRNQFGENSDRRQNLLRGFATPAELLKSRLSIVSFAKSSHVTSPKDF